MKPSEVKERLDGIRDKYYDELHRTYGFPPNGDRDIGFLLDLVDELLVLQDIVSDHVEDRGLKGVVKECLHHLSQGSYDDKFSYPIPTVPMSFIDKLKILVGEHK